MIIPARYRSAVSRYFLLLCSVVVPVVSVRPVSVGVNPLNMSMLVSMWIPYWLCVSVQVMWIAVAVQMHVCHCFVEV